MIFVTLNEEMEKLLSSIKGAETVSYECERIFNNVYGKLRIHTEKGSIEVTNFHQTRDILGAQEDASGFQCKKVKKGSCFKPLCGDAADTFRMRGLVTEIKIINDAISVNDGAYEISFDQAIVIKTKDETVMFSRDAWFSEDITVSEHDDYELLVPVSRVAELWSFDGDNKVKITRTSRQL